MISQNNHPEMPPENQKLSDFKNNTLSDAIDQVHSDALEKVRFENRLKVFNIIDLDDTLFSREPQMNLDPNLRLLRGEEGTKYVLGKLGIPYFIQTHYEGKVIPDGIIDKVEPNNSLILSAGTKELQLAKIETQKQLENFPIKVVKKGISKVLETIEYVNTKLVSAPETIRVYEDRPHHFVQYRKMIEATTGSKLEIYYVLMDENTGYKDIKLIEEGSNFEFGIMEAHQKSLET